MNQSFLMGQLIQMISMAGSPDAQAAEAARSRLSSLGKPIGSFGQLEDMITRMAAVKGKADIRFDKKAVVVMCGDHGVVAEGVTQTGSRVTRIVAGNIVAGKGAVSLLADHAGVDVYTIDMGMLGTPYENRNLAMGQIADCRIGSGTGDRLGIPAGRDSRRLPFYGVGGADS
jgi:nicotinate-nucleotide--dimethylbenzimidazole phosphoribosyltransferase